MDEESVMVQPGSRWRLVHCPDAPERHGMEITLGERLEIVWHRNSKKERKRTGEVFRRMWGIKTTRANSTYLFVDTPDYYIAEDDLIKMWELVDVD